jgi:hypothetical protein
MSAPPILGCHRLLLWADSWLPGQVVDAARDWLAGGLTADVSSAVSFAALSAGVSIPAEFASLLPNLAGLTTTDRQLPDVTYSPASPDTLAESSVPLPQSLDLSSDPSGRAGPDETDLTAIAEAAVLPDAVALWRSWRYRAGAAHEATRAYLLQLDAGPARLAAVAARLRCLAFQTEADLPAHQLLALDCGALLWTRAAAPAPRLARPHTSRGRSPSPAEVHYLSSGTQLMPDLAHISPAHGSSPPMLRTDGHWIWSDALSTLDPPFAAHLTSRHPGSTRPPVITDQLTIRRALAAVARHTSP